MVRFNPVGIANIHRTVSLNPYWLDLTVIRASERLMKMGRSLNPYWLDLTGAI